jgi:hypothetical protein
MEKNILLTIKGKINSGTSLTKLLIALQVQLLVS